MTTLLSQIANLYRDPIDVSEADGDLPIPTLDQLETTLIWALRDGEDALAIVLAAEIRRLKNMHDTQLEAVLVGNSAGIWRLH